MRLWSSQRRIAISSSLKEPSTVGSIATKAAAITGLRNWDGYHECHIIGSMISRHTAVGALVGALVLGLAVGVPP
jgi:hypothetical protein